MAVAMPEFPGHVPTGESELAANVRQDMLLALMGLQQRAAATFMVFIQQLKELQVELAVETDAAVRASRASGLRVPGHESQGLMSFAIGQCIDGASAKSCCDFYAFHPANEGVAGGPCGGHTCRSASQPSFRIASPWP